MIDESEPTQLSGYREQFYKSVLDRLSDGVYFVSPLRQITFWNRAVELV